MKNAPAEIWERLISREHRQDRVGLPAHAAVRVRGRACPCSVSIYSSNYREQPIAIFFCQLDAHDQFSKVFVLDIDNICDVWP